MSKALTRVPRMRKHLTPFNVVEKLLTLTSLGLVVGTVGTKLGPILHLTGRPGTVVAVAVALTLDALWLGASIRTDQAIRQRNWLAASVMGAVTLLAIASSVAVLALLGHASVYASVPVVALAFSGLRIFSENAMADTATTKRIAERSAADRNKAAMASSSARQLLAGATTDVVLDTADHMASLGRDVALARQLTKADVRMAKERAKAQERLAKAEKKHGEQARLFLARRVTELPGGVTEHSPAPRPEHSPALTSVTDVTEAVTVRLSELPVTEDGIPSASPKTAEELLAMGYGTKTVRFSELPVTEDGVPVLVSPSDLRDSAAAEPVTAQDLLALGSELVTIQVSDLRDSRDAGVTDDGEEVNPWYSLDGLADLSGVERPVPGQALTEDQIEVVMRWIRYQVAPESYRQASVLVREMKFKASEKKMRLVWNHLEAIEKSMTDTTVE